MKTLQRVTEDMQLIASATKCLATLLDGSDLAKNFVLVNSGSDHLQTALRKYLYLKESNHLDPSNQFNGNTILLCITNTICLLF